MFSRAGDIRRLRLGLYNLLGNKNWAGLGLSDSSPRDRRFLGKPFQTWTSSAKKSVHLDFYLSAFLGLEEEEM